MQILFSLTPIYISYNTLLKVIGMEIKRGEARGLPEIEVQLCYLKEEVLFPEA